jgi:CheY-like chemotaxis protein
MGGRVWAESVVGRGSDFHFTTAVAVGRPLNSPEPGALGGLRWMVVDPSAVTRRILRGYADSWGTSMTDAASAAEALAAIESGGVYDLVILDPDLPSGTGVVVERVRQANPLTQVVFFAKIGEQAPAAATATEVVLRKPLKQSELFKALLRFRRASEQPPTSADRRLDDDLQPMEVLVVDDSDASCDLLRRFLARHGFGEPDVVSSGSAALDAVERKRYDVVLMDVEMPGMSGIEATRKIRSRFAKPRRPWIVGVTASDMDSTRHDCMRAGMDDFLTKPIRESRLVAALRSARIGRN